jgi:SpoIID/LytB domain protein
LKALTIAYRTYGYWKVQNGTSYEKEGFHVTDTGTSQVYGGYGREDNQPNVVSATKATAGTIVKYGDQIAITPYCSGTDGNTRSWKDVWGSDNYPWCQSVPDPLGIKSNATTLSGNHMVGMSATGAYNYAKNQGWTYDKILTYYYKGVTLALGW